MIAFCGLDIALRALFVDDGVAVTTWRNFVAAKLSLLESAYPSVYDPDLGYVLRPGYSGTNNRWRTAITIDANGLPANGPGARVLGKRPDIRRVGLLRGLPGYSYAVDLILRGLGCEDWWYVGQWETERAHEQGPAVSCH